MYVQNDIELFHRYIIMTNLRKDVMIRVDMLGEQGDIYTQDFNTLITLSACPLIFHVFKSFSDRFKIAILID